MASEVDPQVVAECYLDVGDGGASFKITDRGSGPRLELSTHHFGNCVQETVIKTSKKGLLGLRDMIDKALAKHDYSKDYCYVAEPRTYYSGTHSEGSEGE